MNVPDRPRLEFLPLEWRAALAIEQIKMEREAGSIPLVLHTIGSIVMGWSTTIPTDAGDFAKEDQDHLAREVGRLIGEGALDAIDLRGPR